MADSTDSAFGFILFILFLALLGYAAGGVSASSSSTTGTTSGTTHSLPPLSGSAVSSCTGTLKQDEPSSTTSTSPNLNLRVWVDPMDAGQKCATATASTQQTVKVTLAYTADKTQMVSDTGNQTASVQVNGTDNYCVSAVGEIVGTGVKMTIPKVVEPCSMTAPAMQPVNPVPGVPAGTHHKEDEEGY